MSLTSIIEHKVSGFEMAREHIAREGKDWTSANFNRYARADGAEVAFWRGYLNALVGMTPAENNPW